MVVTWLSHGYHMVITWQSHDEHRLDKVVSHEAVALAVQQSCHIQIIVVLSHKV